MARTLAMWNEALKEWNASHGGKWTIPRKGSAEYEQVMAIVNKKAGHPSKESQPKDEQPKDEVPPTEYHPGKFVKPSPFKSWLVRHFEKNR